MFNPISCHVTGPSFSSSSTISVVTSFSWSNFVGSTGIRLPSPTHDIRGGGGTGVSRPCGASGGGCARYGYRSSNKSRTGMEKSINASSTDAFSTSLR